MVCTVCVASASSRTNSLGADQSGLQWETSRKIQTQRPEPQARQSLNSLLSPKACGNVRRSIEAYLKEPGFVTRAFQKKCDGLLKNVMPSDPVSHAPTEIPESYPDHLNRKLFTALRRCGTCVLCPDESKASGLGAWHPTRVYLKNKLETRDKLVLFDVITASTRDYFWQDLVFRIPLY
jgi:hypothetical protein